MKDEVNRISKDTEYNSKSLLDGSLDTRVYTDNANVSRVNVSDYVNQGKYEITIKTTSRNKGNRQCNKCRESNLQVQVQLTCPEQFPSMDTLWILTKMIQKQKFMRKSVQAEVGEAEMKTDDGKFTGLQASRYGSSASLVLTFSERTV